MKFGETICICHELGIAALVSLCMGCHASMGYFYDFHVFSKISDIVLLIKGICIETGSGLSLQLGKNKLLYPMVLIATFAAVLPSPSLGYIRASK